MNSFAMIFGHCVWIPPSPKASLAALLLFYGVGISGEADDAAAEQAIAQQYVATGKTQDEAKSEIRWLRTCFARMKRLRKTRQAAGGKVGSYETDAITEAHFVGEKDNRSLISCRG
jgi:hypothetical protein